MNQRKPPTLVELQQVFYATMCKALEDPAIQELPCSSIRAEQAEMRGIAAVLERLAQSCDEGSLRSGWLESVYDGTFKWQDVVGSSDLRAIAAQAGEANDG